MTSTTGYDAQLEDRSLGYLLYGLMSGFPLLLIPVLLSLLINLTQKQEELSPLLASHLRWQRQANMGLFLLLALGYWLPQLWLSLLVYLMALGWFCYRLLKGWLSLLDGLEI
ncbi:hypothetical protein [Shewanella salipaludis]|uniref:DUF4870 domain-containing protein n=1 Tax=Shewanella salipaludis TaxID=2723052 RepID=A0A972G070_9GAMM|nr:hypothetical protein [Shewanella salipaludis]NMH64769.1 hypothetical protein [Shewanella salipaludis]